MNNKDNYDLTGYKELSHKASDETVYELARGLYNDSKRAFREAIANSIDEGSEKIKIDITRNGKSTTITIQDWGAGIEDPDKFMIYGRSLKKDSTIPRYNRKKREIIGNKGFGKLSLLCLQDTIIVETNNGMCDYRIIMQMPPKKSGSHMFRCSEILKDRGTKVIIQNPFPIKVPCIKELKHYLQDIFSLRIINGIKIILNDEELRASRELDPEEHHLFDLKGDIPVTGNLKPNNEKKKRGKVQILIDHLVVKQIDVDFADQRKVWGWVNCNQLRISTDRDSIVEDDEAGIYRKFIAQLRKHVAKHFEKVEPDPNEITESQKRFTTKIDEMLIPLIRNAPIFKEKLPQPPNPEIQPTAASMPLPPNLPQQKGLDLSLTQPQITTISGATTTGTEMPLLFIRPEPKELEEEEPPPPPPPKPRGLPAPPPDENTPKVNTEGGNKKAVVYQSYKKRTQAKKQKQLSSPLDAGIPWIIRDCGNAMDPLIYNEESNQFVQNKGSDILRYAHRPDKATGAGYESNERRIIPYLARLAVKIWHARKWQTYTPEEMYKHENEYTGQILRDRGLV
jgi:hypothetical protein